MGLSGTCMCGAVAYESTSDAEMTAVCHCIDCQKWTGGPYTSNAIVPEDSFKVTKGTVKVCDMTAASGKSNYHHFCGDCGSSLFTKLVILPGKIVIKAGGLDNGDANLGGKIQTEFYVKDRVSYLPALEGAEQKPLFP